MAKGHVGMEDEQKLTNSDTIYCPQMSYRYAGPILGHSKYSGDDQAIHHECDGRRRPLLTSKCWGNK